MVKYDKDGNVCKLEENKIYASSTETESSGDMFYCRFDERGALYNFATSTQISTNIAGRFKMRKVSKDCFDMYMKYLKTKANSTYATANRQI